MGLSDLFSKLKGGAGGSLPPAPQSVGKERPKVFHEDRERMFDLAQTQSLSELFGIAREKRNAGWQGAFFHAVWTASVEVAEPPMLIGPDGFSYLRLQIPEPAKAFESNSLGNLARQAMERGNGVALFASPQTVEPEYVISMGVLDSLLTYDSWLGDPVDLGDLERLKQTRNAGSSLQKIKMESGTEILVGTPSALLLPAHTARALYFHLRDRWKVVEPRISLMVNGSIAPSRNLVINRRLGEFPSPEAASRESRFLLWYFPPSRSLMLMPDSFKEADMRLLTEFFPQVNPEAKS